MKNEGQALAISDEQHLQMMDYLATTRYSARDTAIYAITRFAGCRIGTVAQLTLDDILDSEGRLRDVVILRSKITKGKKTITAYFNHPVLRESLEKYLETRHSKRIENVFVSQKGCAFSPNSLAQLMLRHYNRAGLEGCSSHSGRRTALSKLLKAGVDIVAVSKIAGHSSIATTQRYIHHDQDELLAAVANT
ncbi:MAG: hypothetical protein CBB97_25820 [Candidatus Endolissoclinum sp. TMED37]|nr:MAG: hypothetical protein CBB97_25820 [Candidatus Endolissoclinum sp. TMED37]|tara:strand:- start:2859 stop:3434 length:576 start_codon:yes stop_codon:yes gene_type:complete